MARPRSEDKRQSILAAATQVFAQDGPAAPTARIAKAAGVAEGSLFTYFASKDELVNQLYLELKAELRAAMLAGYDPAASLRERAGYIWRTYVDWGVTWPQKRKVMQQLMVSERLTAETRAAGSAGFEDFNQLFDQGRADGLLREQPPLFTPAIFGALAETSIDFMIRLPEQAAAYREAGFEAFWHAVASG
jgi:AcrR family transcriptional regulator